VKSGFDEEDWKEVPRRASLLPTTKATIQHVVDGLIGHGVMDERKSTPRCRARVANGPGADLYAVRGISTLLGGETNKHNKCLH
jgi:hypothetical protein